MFNEGWYDSKRAKEPYSMILFMLVTGMYALVCLKLLLVYLGPYMGVS